MSTKLIFEPRQYQTDILERTVSNYLDGKNIIIELDCGLGKRFLQYSLLFESLKNERIILILQASSSLYETFRYFKKIYDNDDLALIDSRTPSKIRSSILSKSRIVLTLPQTLVNTLKQYPKCRIDNSLLIINEVDQIIRRLSSNGHLKQPYSRIFEYFKHNQIIGMSGTLRDDHYVQNEQQLQILNELKSLCDIFQDVILISMDSIKTTDLQQYIKYTHIFPTSVLDDSISMISLELEQHIEEYKLEIMKELKENYGELYLRVKKNQSLLFSPLPIDEKLSRKFLGGYMIRKYLWAMTGNKSYFHLLRYGLDKHFISNTLPRIPSKFIATVQLVKKHRKSVILCSFLDTVDTLEGLIKCTGINTIKITGKINSEIREQSLELFRSSTNPIVAILSNVGERDLDLPEADQLIIFDLVRTPKTVYQKLKRSRDGTCHILFYQETDEYKKVHSVIKNINKRYSWSTIIEETIEIKL